MILTKNVLARAHKKFPRGQHPEIYLLTLKRQDKTKMELPLDMVSISASSCRTNSASEKQQIDREIPVYRHQNTCITFVFDLFFKKSN